MIAMQDAAEVDRAVQAAHATFLKWREVPVIKRVQVLYLYKALLEKYAEDVVRIMTGENGKPFDDAKLSVRRAALFRRWCRCGCTHSPSRQATRLC